MRAGRRSVSQDAARAARAPCRRTSGAASSEVVRGCSRSMPHARAHPHAHTRDDDDETFGGGLASRFSSGLTERRRKVQSSAIADRSVSRHLIPYPLPLAGPPTHRVRVRYPSRSRSNAHSARFFFFFYVIFPFLCVHRRSEFLGYMSFAVKNVIKKVSVFNTYEYSLLHYYPMPYNIHHTNISR